ncbi:LCP family protein [Nonomuraea mangrovi]|uniref:LCP family protein n=1 Tax=Nonomuraea mangrovi TaxID=2316207 RepID=A0ABW4TGE4_9ACTN
MLRRFLIIAGLLVAMVLAGGFALLMQRQSTYDGNIRRIAEPFPVESERPPKPVGEAQNWLLIGSDRRPGEAGAQRADTIMILHLPADRARIYVIGIPRDAYVPIKGHGNDKINASYAYGGPKLLISTVERFTGVRIDHFAAVDFAGFVAMTKAIGGIDVYVSRTTHDPMNKVTWRQGTVHLEGEQTLLFVRQRYNLPGGDFDRIRRQQAVIKAMGKKLRDSSVFEIDAFLQEATKSLSVDPGVSVSLLRDLAIELRGVEDLTALTTPNTGSAMVKGASVVKIDKAQADRLFEAVRQDAIARYVEESGGINDTDLLY